MTEGDALHARAAELHAGLLTLDAHLDAPAHFARPEWDFAEHHRLEADLAQVDLPRMAGNLDGGFLVVFTHQGPLNPAAYAEALAAARQRSDVIDRTLAQHADRIGLALEPVDALRLKRQGRAVAFKSIENSYPFGDDVTLMAEFYARGVRLAGPVHSRSNQFADSSTDGPLWAGLSALGRQWVGEANRLGILIDASHASDAALDQMLDLSSVPLVLSHSGVRAAYDHPRNLDDARLRRVAKLGGVVCFTTIYLSEMRDAPERFSIMREMQNAEAGSEAQAALVRRWRALDREPMWAADLDGYMAALLHLLDVVGVDHVGFGADWDGGGGIVGLEDVTRLPAVTARLLAAGLSEADCAKLWSGNLLRVLGRAQAGRSTSLAIGGAA